jgi:hypothetical protein
LGVVAEGFAYVGEVFLAAGAEDEAAAELERVFAQAPLAMSGGLGALAGGHVVFAEEMKKVGLLEFEGAVGFAALVDQQREVDSGLLTEGFCILRIAQAYGSQMRSFAAELRFKLAQLRNVLAAEDSTIMTQEDQHHGMLGPQRAQANRMAIAIGQGNVGQPAAIGLVHGSHFNASKPFSLRFPQRGNSIR